MKPWALAFLALAACVPTPAPLRKEASPPDLIRFFDGVTSGRGSYTQILSRPKLLMVTSQGYKLDYKFMLDQQIHIVGKDARKRQWVMTPDGKGGWTTSLTDAVGPVTIAKESDALRISYQMKGGVVVTQYLRQLSPSRIDNRMRFSKYGMTVARIHETIIKD